MKDLKRIPNKRDKQMKKSVNVLCWGAVIPVYKGMPNKFLKAAKAIQLRRKQETFIDRLKSRK
jgi:hypothetical protein